MKFAFSTNGFTRRTVFQAVESIGAMGYEGVELLADVPHLYAPSVSAADLAKLKAVLVRAGLAVANLNANTAVGYYGREFWEPLFEPSLANPERRERQWRIDYSKRCIDMAHALGAPCVSVTSGRMVPGVDPEKSLDFLRRSLAGLLDHAAGSGVRIGIEYEPGLLIERYEELASLLCEMNSPRLGANLDLGHSHVLGEAPETVIEGLSPRIFNLHVEDIRGGKHYHLIPGLGDMDFRRLFDILKKVSYGGFATVELYTYPHRPEAAAAASLEYLKGI
jgi:sugar phosphate isomerase/epimerase